MPHRLLLDISEHAIGATTTDFIKTLQVKIVTQLPGLSDRVLIGCSDFVVVTNDYDRIG